MNSVKVLAKGQVVIPATLRKKYDIHPGDVLKLFEYGDTIYIVPQNDDPIKKARGSLPKSPSLTGELLSDRKKDAAR